MFILLWRWTNTFIFVLFPFISVAFFI
jgi:hypothetical protein